MVDRNAEGFEGTPFPMSVEFGKIREFADATGSRNEAYRVEDAVIPATFLTTQMFWEQWAGADANPWERVQMDPKRGMHAEQEFVFHGEPPHAGDRLTARSRIGDIVTKQGGRGELTFVTLVTEFHAADGRLVAEARMTGVEIADEVAP